MDDGGCTMFAGSRVIKFCSLLCVKVVGRREPESPLHVLHDTKLPNDSSGKRALRIQKSMRERSAGTTFRANQKSKKTRGAKFVVRESTWGGSRGGSSGSFQRTATVIQHVPSPSTGGPLTARPTPAGAKSVETNVSVRNLEFKG